ncbi:unnamed protein product [Rotaria sp. Silwood2]|nr:unnamed protein product [Rotaria sp. Silwood2]
MIPATAVPPHSITTLDRVAFCKSVREKRKQLQLNHHTNGKDNISSSTENAFLTQMLQSSSISATSSSVSSSLSIPSLLRKGNLSSSSPSSSSSSSSSHRTVTGTLTNILPALLNGTLQSPRAMSPCSTSTNIAALNSPTSTSTTDTLVDIKCSTSLPVSPITHTFNNNPPDSPNNYSNISTNYSPPRCRSYPMTDLTKRSSPSISTMSPSESIHINQSFPSPTSSLLGPASSCPLLTNMNTTTTTSTIIASTSPSPDDTTPKIVRSASVKSCASDSGVSSSSPLSDNNIVHVFRTNQIENNNQPHISTGSRKRKSLAHFYDELNKDKKFSSETTVSSGFSMPTSTINNNNNNNNIPYSQHEALAIGYAQYALMHTLTQQFRVNYPAALLHAAAASGYLPLPSPMMAAAAAAAAVAAAASANSNTNGSKISTLEKNRERRKPQPQPQSDNNNNHIQSNDQPYRRETYQTLLESSRLLGQQQQKLLKPVPIDLRKNNRTNDNSPIPSNFRCPSSSSSTSPPNSPLCTSPPKSLNIESNNDYVCIPKKLMPVIGARINDWLERNVTFTLSLSVIQNTLDNNKDKYLLLSRIWHRLLLTSMIENSFEIYVTKDLQITNDIPSSSSSPTTIVHPTENDVKQIESLISRGKTLEIDEIGFNLIREVIIYKEAKTLFNNLSGNLFEKAECQAQTKLMSWCSTRVKYSKIVFFLCNIYQVKEDIFERLFCVGSMHQSTPIHTHIQRLLESSNSMDF